MSAIQPTNRSRSLPAIARLFIGNCKHRSLAAPTCVYVRDAHRSQRWFIDSDRCVITRRAVEGSQFWTYVVTYRPLL